MKKLTIARPISVKPYLGKWVVFSGKVKAVDVAKPSRSYLGVKMMIQPGNEASVTRFGSYDWKENAAVSFIPENAKRLNFIIGLQGTKGTVLYSDLKVSAYPPSANGNFLPTGKVLESMMANRSGAYLPKAARMARKQSAFPIRTKTSGMKWFSRFPSTKCAGTKSNSPQG